MTATVSSRPRPAPWTPTWRDWRLGLGAAIVTAGTYALLAGRWTPRGPITATEALTAIGISLVVGGLAGAATRSRWAMLLAPATFVAVFELTRLGSIGPTIPVEAAVGDVVCFSSLTPHRTGRNTADAVRKAYALQDCADGTLCYPRGEGEGALQEDETRQFFVVQGGAPLTGSAASS